MARGDGKNKFYRLLNVHKDVIVLIRHYNKVFKKRAYIEAKGSSDGTTGTTY